MEFRKSFILQVYTGCEKAPPSCEFLGKRFLDYRARIFEPTALEPSLQAFSGPSLVSRTCSCFVLATAEVRRRKYPDMMNIVSDVQPSSHILNNSSSSDLTYLKLNYSSINLVENTCVPAHKPGISQNVFRVKATEEK